MTEKVGAVNFGAANHVKLPYYEATMCCFSRRVEFVKDTSIFARRSGQRLQLLVYSMKVGAPEDLAMILPIPVAAGTREDDVGFINLEKYPDFFADLATGFPGRTLSTPADAAAPPPRALLKVENVGRFAASFVPTVADFSRLDPRFRLPEGAWKSLGLYAKYGFAVFQLKKGAGRIHPMAFAFPTARPDYLYFPTVHIHDGEAHPQAEFDHCLYCQPGQSGLHSVVAWDETPWPAKTFLNIAKAPGLVVPDEHALRLQLSGVLTNQDTWLRVA